MTPQELRITKFIHQRGSITSIQAWNKCGVSRLSSVIFRLKRSPHNLPILKEWVNVNNRFGEHCRVARYRFEQVPFNTGVNK